MATDGGADPDPDIPIIPFDPNARNADWYDVENDSGGISHEGGERRDMARMVFEYTVLQK